MLDLVGLWQTLLSSPPPECAGWQSGMSSEMRNHCQRLRGFSPQALAAKYLNIGCCRWSDTTIHTCERCDVELLNVEEKERLDIFVLQIMW